jgi:thiamine pyrophosphokinase
MVAEVIGDLDSTKSIVKDIKKELAHEKDINVKQSTGDQFDFQPIKLPAEDGNQR